MRYTLILITIFLLSFTDFLLPTNTSGHNNEELIMKYEEDITGDGNKETIELKGIRLSTNTDYYREVWIDIESKQQQNWQITYQGGYNPHLDFIDLNNDQVNDIFYQSSSDDQYIKSTYHIHTLKDGQVNEMALPKQNHITSEFIDQFKISIQLSPTTDPITLSIESESDYYIKNGVYNEQGKLLKEKSATLNPSINIEPLLISARNGYGLVTQQNIVDTFNKDDLTTIETFWHFEDNQWTILKSKLDPIH